MILPTWFFRHLFHSSLQHVAKHVRGVANRDSTQCRSLCTVGLLKLQGLDDRSAGKL